MAVICFRRPLSIYVARCAHVHAQPTGFYPHCRLRLLFRPNVLRIEGAVRSVMVELTASQSLVLGIITVKESVHLVEEALNDVGGLEVGVAEVLLNCFITIRMPRASHNDGIVSAERHEHLIIYHHSSLIQSINQCGSPTLVLDIEEIAGLFAIVTLGVILSTCPNRRSVPTVIQ